MKFWLSLGQGSLDELVEATQAAEALGYEGVWLPEHVVIKTGDKTPHPTGFEMPAEMPFLDPFCVFSALAAVTTRIRFLSYIYVVPLRNVFALTKQAATLAVLSDNRFVLGTGVGWLREEYEAVGEDWSSRGRRMDEMLEIMPDFWDDGYAEYHGEHYDFPRSAMFPVPTEQVPIWIGGHSAPAAARAARFDGYIPMYGHAEDTREDYARIDAYRAEHGLGKPFERVVMASSDPSPGEIRRMQDEYQITSVIVATNPFGGTGGPLTAAEKRSLAERYATEIIARV